MNEEFKKYYKRLTSEAMLKSVLSGLTTGFAVLLVMSAILWFTASNLYWTAFIAFGAVTAGTTPIYYYKRFRPSMKDMAKRLDNLGLDERMLTMTEFSEDNSYIAQRQRQDAMESLKKINADLLKFAVSVPLIVSLAVVGVAGAGMSTVCTLAGNKVINGGQDTITGIVDVIAPPQTYELNFEIVGNGYIDGDIFQVVDSGEDASEVFATADDDYVFVGWIYSEDGEPPVIDEEGNFLDDRVSEDPLYVPMNVTGDATYYAVFLQMSPGENGPGESGEGDGEGEPSDESDPGDSKPGDNDSNGEQQGGNESGEGGGAGYNPSDSKNQAIDGNTPYGEVLQDSDGNGLAGEYLGGLKGGTSSGDSGDNGETP